MRFFDRLKIGEIVRYLPDKNKNKISPPSQTVATARIASKKFYVFSFYWPDDRSIRSAYAAVFEFLTGSDLRCFAQQWRRCIVVSIDGVKFGVKEWTTRQMSPCRCRGSGPRRYEHVYSPNKAVSHETTAHHHVYRLR